MPAIAFIVLMTEIVSAWSSDKERTGLAGMRRMRNLEKYTGQESAQNWSTAQTAFNEYEKGWVASPENNLKGMNESERCKKTCISEWEYDFFCHKSKWQVIAFKKISKDKSIADAFLTNSISVSEVGKFEIWNLHVSLWLVRLKGQIKFRKF